MYNDESGTTAKTERQLHSASGSGYIWKRIFYRNDTLSISIHTSARFILDVPEKATHPLHSSHRQVSTDLTIEDTLMASADVISTSAPPCLAIASDDEADVSYTFSMPSHNAATAESGSACPNAECHQPNEEDASQDVSIDEMFKIMESARKTQKASERSLLSADPSVHVCSEHTCPHLEINQDKTLVCSVTGACYNQIAVHDRFTAGHVTLYDENNVRVGKHSAGKERFRRKRNAVGDSRRAMLSAKSVPDEVGYDEQSPSTPRNGWVAGSLRSGVSTPSPTNDKAPMEYPTPKKQCKLQDGSMNPVERIRLLTESARDIVDSLTASNRRMETVRRAPSSNAASEKHSVLHQPSVNSNAIQRTPTQAVDSKQLFLEQARKYMLRQTLQSCPPRMDDLHNIAINIRVGLAKQRAREEAHSFARTRSIRYIRIRDAAAHLAVSLWILLLRSPHMQSTRRTGDSFRPFAAGVFFNMRQGVRLPGNIEIIPKCPTIADALPEVRSQHREKHSHTNHLAAHRGANTLHSCIRSIDMSRARQAFEPIKSVVDQLKMFENAWS